MMIPAASISGTVLPSVSSELLHEALLPVVVKSRVIGLPIGGLG
jgi:hypothetical protein